MGNTTYGAGTIFKRGSIWYSTREAGFLVLAALHSGYFLRRQYRAYLGVGFGYPDDVFTSKLLRLGHAREVAFVMAAGSTASIRSRSTPRWERSITGTGACIIRRQSRPGSWGSISL